MTFWTACKVAFVQCSNKLTTVGPMKYWNAKMFSPTVSQTTVGQTIVGQRNFVN